MSVHIQMELRASILKRISKLLPVELYVYAWDGERVRELENLWKVHKMAKQQAK